MATTAPPPKVKLHGRAFYESIGSPKFVLAPMVDQSEFAWRMLTRSYMPPSASKDLLAYTPMFHARMFADAPKYRADHFQPVRTAPPSPPSQPAAAAACPTPPHTTATDLYLDGNPALDRPLFVQFCANEPAELLAAAKHVQGFCDAVDLNLGCPQGIAKRGRYGAFLQETPELIGDLVRTLHEGLDVPVTAKMRVLETREQTLEYARGILAAGASVLTVHGRLRCQKGHNTGLADWGVLRYLRENLPRETVLFANGNILRHEDIAACLEATGFDAVMSAEGNLYDPTIFAAPPPVGQEGTEYWRGRDGRGGYRMDAVLRRYMDIIHRYVLEQEPPARKPLFQIGDAVEETQEPTSASAAPNHLKRPAEDDELELEPKPEAEAEADADATTTTPTTTTTGPQLQPQPQPRAAKKQKTTKSERKQAAKQHSRPEKCSNPNLIPMQAHLFHLLRPLVSRHTRVRDALARCRAGDVAAFENVLTMVEDAVRQGLLEYEREAEAEAEQDPASQQTTDVQQQQQQQQQQQKEAEKQQVTAQGGEQQVAEEEEEGKVKNTASSVATVALCKRPYFICQPYVRPLPEEALEKGAMALSKKEIARLEREKKERAEAKPLPLEVMDAQSLPQGVPQGGVMVAKEEVPVGESNGPLRGEKSGDKDGAKEEVTTVEAEVPRQGLVCG